MMNFSIRNFLLPCLSILLMGYFTYHIFQGDRGVIAMFRLQKSVAQLEQTKNTLQKEKTELEHRAYLLNPKSLDTDLLEEQAKRVLNFAYPTEVVIKNNLVGRKNDS